MRSRRAGAGVRPADLDRDHRLAQAPGLFQRRDEPRPVADRLTEQHDRVGVRVLDHVVQEIGHPQIGFVAGRNHITEAQTRRLAAIEQRKADPAGLSDHA